MMPEYREYRKTAFSAKFGEFEAVLNRECGQMFGDIFANVENLLVPNWTPEIITIRRAWRKTGFFIPVQDTILPDSKSEKLLDEVNNFGINYKEYPQTGHLDKSPAANHDNDEVNEPNMGDQRQNTVPAYKISDRVVQSVCNVEQFQCEDKTECIANVKQCNGVTDCRDESDEQSCHGTRRHDKENGTSQHDMECWNKTSFPMFRCTSGQCIPFEDLCDANPGVMDCDSGMDSKNCSSPTCPSDQYVKCPNGTCVSMVTRCSNDSIVYPPCVDWSDKLQCIEHTCPSNKFQCKNGVCVPLETRCDNATTNVPGCSDNSDEENCEESVCGKDWFRCTNGQCVRIQKRCDSETIDCNDGSDEEDCDADSCLHTQFRCRNGQCLPSYYGRCNGISGTPHDCDDGSDEWDCPLSKCPRRYFRCNSGQCLEHDICSNKNTYRCYSQRHEHCDTSECPPYYFRCKDGECLHPTSRCDSRVDCSEGEDELHCGQPVCRDDQIDCIGRTQYCVQKSALCDGVDDCIISKEDEQDCTFDVEVCPSRRTCMNSDTCIHAYQYCDTTSDCPYHVDEQHCQTICPVGCECFDEDFDCSAETKTVAENMTSNFPWPLQILFHDAFPMDMISLPKVFHLNLSRSSLTEVPSRLLQYFPNVNVLDLSHNHIFRVKAGDFNGHSVFYYLDLSYNWISEIEDFAFKGLRINQLYLQMNRIPYFGADLFGGMAADGTIHTHKYKYCCVRPPHLPEENCFPKADQFSSCTDLMRNVALRVFLWIIGLFALTGNAFAVLMRVRNERCTLQRSYGIFVTNLCISDFLMGVYMMIIAIADMTFRDKYITVADIWTASPWCKFAGIISMMSSESSVLFIFIITVDRFITIRYPFGQLRFSKKTAIIISACIWCVSFTLATVPLLFRGFYGECGVCVALPIQSQRSEGWQYSVCIYLGLNCALFLLITVGQFLIYYEIVSVRRKNNTLNIRRDDMRVARRLMLVVLTDHFCWIPIGCFTIMSLCGHGLTGDGYIWTVILVLPVNSALNPFLYTLMSKLC